jgi:hypothetical protein
MRGKPLILFGAVNTFFGVFIWIHVIKNIVTETFRSGGNHFQWGARWAVTKKVQKI